MSKSAWLFLALQPACAPSPVVQPPYLTSPYPSKSAVCH